MPVQIDSTALENALLARFGHCRAAPRDLVIRHDNGLVFGSRRYVATVTDYVSDLLTRLAECRDMPAERKAAEGEAFLRELLPAAWVKRNPG